MEKCDLFHLDLTEWSEFALPNQDWGNIKSQFGKAYNNLLISGPGLGVPDTIVNTQ